MIATNYICPHCGSEFDRFHIGKSSCGWVFVMRIYPEHGINNIEDWKKKWKNKKIIDEYGTELSEDELLKIIQCKSSMQRRSVIDGNHCVSRDEFCDYIKGEFS